MLNITKQIEYALIAVKHIKNRENICSAKEISSFYNLPHENVAKTMQKLCKIKYLGAIQGPHGGYYIKKSLDNINLTKFIEDIEGPIGLVNCLVDKHCEITKICNIKSPIIKINDNLRSALSSIRINELIRE